MLKKLREELNSNFFGFTVGILFVKHCPCIQSELFLLIKKGDIVLKHAIAQYSSSPQYHFYSTTESRQK